MISFKKLFNFLIMWVSSSGTRSKAGIWKLILLIQINWALYVWGVTSLYHWKVHLKVSKSQKQFFLKLSKNDQNNYLIIPRIHNCAGFGHWNPTIKRHPKRTRGTTIRADTGRHWSLGHHPYFRRIHHSSTVSVGTINWKESRNVGTISFEAKMNVSLVIKFLLWGVLKSKNFGQNWIYFKKMVA